MKLHIIHEKPIIAETPIHREFREMMEQMGIEVYSSGTF